MCALPSLDAGSLDTLLDSYLKHTSVSDLMVKVARGGRKQYVPPRHPVGAAPLTLPLALTAATLACAA